MKKTIAKIMAAAMVLSAVPAVALPSLTAEATMTNFNTKASVSALKVVNKDDDSTVVEVTGTGAGTTLTTTNAEKTIDDAILVTTVPEGSELTTQFKVDLTVFASASKADDDFDNFISADATKYYDFSSNSVDKQIKNYVSVKAGQNKVGSNTAIANKYVKSIALTDDAMIKITFNDNEATETVLNSLNDSPLALQIVVGNKGNLVAGAATNMTDELKFWIQIGEKTSTTTTYKNARTADGFIKQATVTLDASGDATITAIRDVDAQVNMKGKDINISEVYIAGVAHPVVKVAARVFKKAKMKSVKAENLKHIASGAFRSCKSMKTFNMGTSSRVKKIHSKAFKGAEKLSTIKFDGRVLKEVGKNAFAGIKSNATIKVKAKKTKFNSDVKLIKKSGIGKKVKVARIAP